MARVLSGPSSVATLSPEDIRPGSGYMAVDVEATSTRVESAGLLGCSYKVSTTEKDEAGYWAGVPSRSSPFPYYLTSSNVLKLAHNAAYDYAVLRRHGFPIDNIADTMILAHLLQYPSLSLKSLAFLVLGRDIEDFKAFNRRCPSPTPEDWASYSTPQSITCYDLFFELLPEVEKLGMKKIFWELLCPAIPIIAEMELNGVKIDVEELGRISQDLDSELEALLAALHNRTGTNLNPNSPKQVARVLYDEMGLPVKRYSEKTHNPSTDEDTLKEFDHPVVKLILECRELRKLKGTYIEGILEKLHKGRIHTSFNLCGTRTGRLSSSNPNLQNIPARTDRGLLIRRAFVASPGYVLIDVDWDQLELRKMAEFSGDPALTEAFQRNKDVHMRTTMGVFGDPKKRFRGKTLNFTMGFGAGDELIASQIGGSLQEARKVRQAFFQLYSGLKKWIDETHFWVKSEGYVRTQRGRIRSLDDPLSHDAEKEGVNTIIQGSSAEAVLAKMVSARGVLSQKRFRTLLQVHDEVLYEVPEEDEAEALAVLEDVMPDFSGPIPYTVTLKRGYNWRDLEEVEGSKERQYERWRSQ